MPQIRKAQEQDLPELVLLCQAHAHYEQANYSTEGKVDLLRDFLFGQQPLAHCLVIEEQDELIGYATYMKQYATWDAGSYIYMDCLFISEKSRSKGWGEKLVEHIKKDGKLLGCDVIQWQTPHFNTRAIKFYERIGAFSKSKERFFLEL